MSLADELLADFEDDDVHHNEAEDEIGEVTEVEEVSADFDYTRKESVKHVAKLRDSPELAHIIQQIKVYASQQRRQKSKEEI